MKGPETLNSIRGMDGARDSLKQRDVIAPPIVCTQENKWFQCMCVGVRCPKEMLSWFSSQERTKNVKSVIINVTHMDEDRIYLVLCWLAHLDEKRTIFMTVPVHLPARSQAFLLVPYWAFNNVTSTRVHISNSLTTNFIRWVYYFFLCLINRHLCLSHPKKLLYSQPSKKKLIPP